MPPILQIQNNGANSLNLNENVASLKLCFPIRNYGRKPIAYKGCHALCNGMSYCLCLNKVAQRVQVNCFVYNLFVLTSKQAETTINRTVVCRFDSQQTPSPKQISFQLKSVSMSLGLFFVSTETNCDWTEIHLSERSRTTTVVLTTSLLCRLRAQSRQHDYILREIACSSR